MPYVDLAGLSRFAGKSKDFASSACAVPDMANWQKTAAAGAVSFSPVPEMPLDPVVNFLFTETGPASGTKGPDNPSTITGVTQAKVTRCGKNILPTSLINYPADRGVDITVNADGSVNMTGTTVGNGIVWFLPNCTTTLNRIENTPFIRGETYTISMVCSNINVTCYVHYSTNNGSSWTGLTSIVGGSHSTFTVPDDSTSFQVWVQVVGGITLDADMYVQVELGSAATAFEPYEGADYAVNLGGTYYGGSVDLSAGTMTVTWVGVVYNGSENITKQADLSDGTPQYNLPVPSYLQSPGTNMSCTHFPFGYTADHGYVRGSGGLGFRVFASDHDTLESFVSWVVAQYAAGTPLTLAYKTESPYTIPLTPLQIYSLSQIDPYTTRINTVYSDQQSVQAGYPKSPQASQNELTNAVVSLGGNV